MSVQRGYLYTAVLAAAALASALVLPGAAPSADPAYALLGAGLIVGALLTVRLRPGEGGTTLVLIPTLIAEARFGLATVPSLAFATLTAALVKGVRGPDLFAAPAIASLAFIVAHHVSRAATNNDVGQLAVFGVTFAIARWALWRAGRRIRSPIAQHPMAERPD